MKNVNILRGSNFLEHEKIRHSNKYELKNMLKCLQTDPKES